MKKSMINTCHIEGVLYEHDLVLKESGKTSKNPGTPFISGTIKIATDDEMVNIVPVHFTYSTALTSTGKANATFETLSTFSIFSVNSIKLFQLLHRLNILCKYSHHYISFQLQTPFLSYL